MRTTRSSIKKIAGQMPQSVRQGVIVAVNRLNNTVDIRMGTSQSARRFVPVSKALAMTQITIGAQAVVTGGNAPMVIGITTSPDQPLVSFAGMSRDARQGMESDQVTGATITNTNPAITAKGGVNKYVKLAPIGDNENTIVARDNAQALRLVGAPASVGNILELMTGIPGWPMRHHVSAAGVWWIDEGGSIRTSLMEIDNNGIKIYNADRTKYKTLTFDGLSEEISV
jgi:hypothetical protein